MATKLTHLRLVPRTDTATLLPQDLVEETALYFRSGLGWSPEDILLLDPPNKDGARQVMEMMAVLEASRP